MGEKSYPLRLDDFFVAAAEMKLEFVSYNSGIIGGQKGKKGGTMPRQVAIAVLVTLCMTILAGCNTVKGVGKDIESGGKAIERSSGK